MVIDKWCLIVDLLSPYGRSVNNGIDRNLGSVSYTSINDGVAIIQHLGPGCC